MCPTANIEVTVGASLRAASVRASIASAIAIAAPLTLVAGLLAVIPAGAQAADFRSVGVAAAIMYDGPSVKGRKLFLAPRATPLEVLSEVNQWVKVRDQTGDVLWIEKKDLSPNRTPVASANMIVRSGPQDNAPVAFQLERGVPLTQIEGQVPAGWMRVRLPDGTQGYARVGDIYGL